MEDHQHGCWELRWKPGYQGLQGVDAACRGSYDHEIALCGHVQTA
jgi:hypothetical protein